MKLVDLFNATEAINEMFRENLPFEVSRAFVRLQKHIEKETEIFNEALQKDERQKFVKELQVKLAEEAKKNKQETPEYRELKEKLEVTLADLEKTAQEKIKETDVDETGFPFIPMKLLEKCEITRIVKDSVTKETVAVKVGISPLVLYRLYPVIREN